MRPVLCAAQKSEGAIFGEKNVTVVVKIISCKDTGKVFRVTQNTKDCYRQTYTHRHCLRSAVAPRRPLPLTTSTLACLRSDSDFGHVTLIVFSSLCWAYSVAVPNCATVCLCVNLTLVAHVVRPILHQNARWNTFWHWCNIQTDVHNIGLTCVIPVCCQFDCLFDISEIFVQYCWDITETLFLH